jgi:hypothetical protein
MLQALDTGFVAAFSGRDRRDVLALFAIPLIELKLFSLQLFFFF